MPATEGEGTEGGREHPPTGPAPGGGRVVITLRDLLPLFHRVVIFGSAISAGIIIPTVPDDDLTRTPIGSSTSAGRS